ncbi:MAG TPA: arginine--tRNA ligase [Candidatus Limnocylindrales bacterium]|nr:arginine--tRNA ligase [Candidatus Limnocylindrales bacterium]
MPTEKTWPIEAYLAERLEEAIARAGLMLPESLRIDVEVPREPEHGDWATPVALTLAKAARRPPRKVAEELIGALEIDPAIVSGVEIAGAGFINFRLAPAWLASSVRRILDDPASYGRSAAGRGEKILIEYVSANPTGPLNVVNARAASFGDALIRIMNAAGYAAEGEFYVNDWGLQAELFGASVRTRFAESLGLPAPPIPEEGYGGEYVAEAAAKLDKEEGKRWLALPEKEQRQAFGRRAIDLMVERQRAQLESFGVQMKRWFRESELHHAGKVEGALARLRERGHVYEKDGAVWFRSTQFGDQEDRVAVRSNGVPTYILPDAAYHDDKFRRGYEHLVDILGPDHHGHIVRVKAVIEALGHDPTRFDVITLQWVKLLRGGEVVKMSKRSGDFISMEELVEEVGVDAARFFFLMRRAESPLDFDMELAVKRSEDNPVYYVQYAHARIAHVLEYARQQGVPEPTLDSADLDLLSEPETLTLLRGLAGFPSLVAASAKHREPHRIPMYLKELAAKFHSFYHQHRVVGPDAAVTSARLLLTRATGVVFHRGLDLLGVSAPESM